MIKEQVQNFIKKYNLTGTFLVAFSGGYDSMCLLDVLNKMGYNIIALHLNHNWRGEESLAEAKNCENFAKKNNIEFYTETLPDNIKKNETSAREARYEFFKNCAIRFNSNVVFTAHNFDDNAETILYRIIKGTGTYGLEGICENRDIFYRPLLTISRKTIEHYCKENKLTPNNDSSNLNTNYKRNFIRHKILPLMKEINPNVVDAINSMSEIAKENNQLINHYLSNDLLTTTKTEQKHIIYKLLKDYNIDYDKKKIEEILTFINENKTSKSGKKLSLTTNLWLFVNDKKVELIPQTIKNDCELKIKEIGEYKFDNKTFSIKPFVENEIIYPKDNEFKALIEIDKIDFTLRYRNDGDFIKPLGNKGTQKLKKYLNEKKIPQHQKDNIALLTQNNEVLWVSGFGISENLKVKTRPTHIIELKGALW